MTTVGATLDIVEPAAGLRRKLGARGAAGFVICNMVGAGIFTVPAFVRAATGSAPASLAVWAVGGVVALCGALCYAELATRMPRAGGEYHYLRQVFGPAAGFLSGIISFVVGFAAATAAAALGVVAYASALVPGWDPRASVGGIAQGDLAAALLIIGAALVHSRGVGLGGRLQGTIAALVVTGIAAFVVLGFSSGRGSLSGLAASGTSTIAAGGWWIAFLQVTFAYSGWNAAAYLAEEVETPSRSLPRALIGGTIAVTGLYLALNAVFFYALPAADWTETIAVGQVAAAGLFGPRVAGALSGLVALAILGSVFAMAAAGPRVYFAMARDGLAPAIVARIDARTGAPAVAIWAQAVLAAVLALTGAFQALLVYIGSALLLFAAAAVVALVVLRWRERASETAAAVRFRAPGGAAAALVFLSVALLAWGNGLRQQPVPTLAALATVAAGGALFVVARHRGWLRVSP